MTKILFCASDRPGHIATGPNAWIQRLIPILRAKHDLDIHTLFLYKGDINDCPTLGFFRKNEMPHHTLNTEKQKYIADQMLSILNLVNENKYTILVANLIIPALYAVPYLKPANIPVIGVLHSRDEFYKGVIKKFIKGELKNQLTVSVAVSRYINELSQDKGSTTRFETIPCGTPIPKIITNWKNSEPLKIMYAGRLEVEAKQILKLTESFIEASKKEPKLNFSIYGSGKEKLNVERLIKEHPESHVEFKGAAKPSDILKHYKNHQVFTLMSDYEGMPVALMEAMACGLVPVCLEEASGVNEIIEHGVNGFIVKDRGVDYQEKLQILLDDQELWQEMSNKARRTISNYYSSKITTEKWAILLKSFDCNTAKPLKIPFRVKLHGELLYYGDNRKPSFKEHTLRKISDNWLKLRLYLRPRARLRTFLGYGKKP